MATEPPVSFLDTLRGALEEVQGDETRNISELGCQQRRDGALALFALSGLVTLALKAGLLQTAVGLSPRKIVYYPVSVLWCCAIAA
jgi:hypothetical protein